MKFSGPKAVSPKKDIIYLFNLLFLYNIGSFRGSLRNFIPINELGFESPGPRFNRESLIDFFLL